jgi:dihydrodipicolinate synthase/N-acetylneuraminate lyase
MPPLSAAAIRGTWASLLLPLDSHDAIDFARIKDQIDYLAASRVDGIYSNGTAGEFFAQSEDEFDRINALLAEKCTSCAKPFQIGASHTSAQISLDRLKRAAAWKPGAIQVILPDWYPPSLAEAAAYLDRMAEAAAPIGLVLYNPPHAKVVLEPEQYVTMERYLVGVKVTAGDSDWYRRMKTSAPRISLFVPGHQLATGMLRGANGSYSNVACLNPVGAKRWNETMECDPSRALGLEARIERFMNEYIVPFRSEQGFGNAALDKLLAAIGCWCDVGTRLRWPYRGIPPVEADRLRPIAHRMLPELFAPGELC